MARMKPFAIAFLPCLALALSTFACSSSGGGSPADGGAPDVAASGQDTAGQMADSLATQDLSGGDIAPGIEAASGADGASAAGGEIDVMAGGTSYKMATNAQAKRIGNGAYGIVASTTMPQPASISIAVSKAFLNDAGAVQSSDPIPGTYLCDTVASKGANATVQLTLQDPMTGAFQFYASTTCQLEITAWGAVGAPVIGTLTAHLALAGDATKTLDLTATINVTRAD
jgi:hypothetical protein